MKLTYNNAGYNNNAGDNNANNYNNEVVYNNNNDGYNQNMDWQRKEKHSQLTHLL